MKSRLQTPGRVTIFVAAILVASAFCVGCSKHPKATSRDSLEYIKQVYTACNTKNAKRLAACEDRLIELESEGKISQQEIKSFLIVLETAKKGDWESAQTMALKYAQDQVR
jgi:hypothetical protein